MTIFVVDSGYGNDDPIGHGTLMANLIKQYCDAPLEVMKVSHDDTKEQLARKLCALYSLCNEGDIVLMAWVIDRDADIDLLVNNIATKCTVVCAAGNFASSVEHFTPAHLQSVITVGCLNKSSQIARLSNWPSKSKEVVWMFGTTMKIEGKDGTHVVSGTSVSAALYTALLYRAEQLSHPEKFMTRAMALLKKKFKSEICDLKNRTSIAG